ncbi:MFS transporter [Actinacidiphila glaucinigra]|uniref:MFS transporter n=1 Tax=Actinacidiphila glaucinigra TaxID=235986 RepID=UPI002E34F47F|nr:MFS transporter [Actinacidiphila glaucinigra]
MTSPALAAPYRRLFALPGTRAFTTGNLLARLPMGMFGVSAVVMIAAAYGSYALAGAVTATGLAATAVVAPWTARLTDRLGQARVAVPAAGLAALGSLALAVCVRLHAPVWTLFAAYAATATTPNTGGMARARWAHLYQDDERARHVANSFEQAADEVCFMLGPVLAAFLCTALFPEAGTLAGALLLFGGILLFAAQRGTEPPPVPRPGSGSGSAAGTGAGRAAVPAVLLTFLATGAVFGALEVTTIAFADSQGHRGAAGAVLALQAAGSCAAGLLYGLRRPRGTHGGRFAASVALMAVLMLGPLPAAALGGLWLLAPALLLAGMATAPTMINGMALIQRRVPPGRLNEGMTLAVTALLGGIAAGSFGAGSVVEHRGAVPAYAIPAVAAATAALVAALSLRAARRRD